MARKRKRKRSTNATAILVAAALLAIVVWAVLPRAAHRHARRATIPGRTTAAASIAPAASPAPAAEATAVASPVQESPAPLASPTESPVSSPAVTESPAPAASSVNGARVAIIIDDCGQWLDTERGYLQLPIPLTLAVLPHVRYTGEIAQEASDAGKGVMLHLPMEPVSHIYPGPGEITTAMSDGEVTRQTEDDLAQVPLAKGLNNHEGSDASADERVMKDVIEVAKAHSLFFIDSRTSAKTVAAQQAQEQGVPTASRDVFLDNRADVAYTEAMLERTAAIAQENGSAIAIGHPKPTTLAAIRLMLPKLQAEGIRFVLVQDLTR